MMKQTPEIEDIPLYAIRCGISHKETFTFDQLTLGETQVVNRVLRQNQGGEDCAMEMVVDIDVR